MSSIVNKKFLFCLLLCETLSIFEVLANDKTAINVTGTLNINPTASVAATRLMVANTGTVNVGDGSLASDLNPRGLIYFWHTKPALGTDVNEIRGELTINQNGDLLNTRKIYIRPSSIPNSAIVTNNGLFANQGELVVGSATRLICQKFSTSDLDSDEIKKRGGILNSSKYTCTANDLNSDSYSLNFNDDNPIKEGTVTCVPGCTINDGADGKGGITGGIFSIDKYLGLTASNGIKYTNDDKYRSDQNTTSTAKVDGQKIKVYLKDAKLQLFINNELNTRNLEVLDTGEDDNDNKLESMFSNLMFINCTAAIPNAESTYLANSLTLPFSNPTNGQSNLYLFKRNLTNNIYPLTSTASDNNFLQVRKLFDYTGNNIYYGIVNNNEEIIKVSSYNTDADTVNSVLYDSATSTGAIPTDGLILTNNSSGGISFSELFNKFINYNCYIPLQSSSLYIETSNEITNNYLDLQFKYFGEPIGTNPYNKDIYIQLIGNKDVCISNSHTEIQDEEEVSQQYNRGLKLVLHNPWATSSNSYTGKLYRNLPDMAETFLTIEEVRNTLYSTSSDYEILQSLANYTWFFMRQDKHWSIMTSEQKSYVTNNATNTLTAAECLQDLKNVLDPSKMNLNKIVMLGYFLDKENQSQNNEYMPIFVANNFNNMSIDEMLVALSQYTLQFVQDTLDYDTLNQSHKDYLESGASNNDKLNYVLSNFTNIGQTAMLNYFLEKKRQDYNEDTVNNNINNAVKITQISQNYDGPAFNNYKINFVNSRDANGNEISNDNTTALKSDCVYCEKVQYTVDYNCNNFSAGNNTTPLIVDEFTISQNINVNGNTETSSLQQSNILTQKLKIDKGAVFKLKGTINVRKLKKYDCVSNGLAYIN